MQGAVLLWTSSFPSGSHTHRRFSVRFSIGGSTGLLLFPPLVPIFVVLAILIAIALARTPFSRRLYALGSNPRTAPLAPIRPVVIWAAAFALSAFFAAVTGVLLLGFTGSAYSAISQLYLFQTITAVVIGGMALVGGRGLYLGMVSRALVLTKLNMLLISLGLQPATMQAAALSLVIVILLSLYGRKPAIQNSI